MKSSLVIANQVVRKNIKSWSYLWMLVAPFLIVVIGLLIVLGVNDGNDSQKISVAVNGPKVVKKALSRNNSFNVVSNKHDEYVLKEFKQSNIDVIVETDSKLDDFKLMINESKGQVSHIDQLKELLLNISKVQKVSEARLTQTQSTLIFAKPNFETKKFVKQGDKLVHQNDNEFLAKMVISYAVPIVVFFFILSYATLVSNEIASEKGSHMSEMILSSISVRFQFLGKLLGVSYLMIIQIGLYVLLGLLITHIFSWDKLFSSIPDIDWSAVSLQYWLFTILFTIISIALYTLFSILLSSLVTRQEEVQQAIMPITLISMVAYFTGATIATASPNSPIVQVLSYVPFLSQNIMPTRLALGNVNFTQGYISLLLSILFLVFFYYLSEKCYEKNVLKYSKRKKLVFRRKVN